MLVGEIVPETLRYLSDNPASPERRAFEHVLIDEYQDLNRAEQDLLSLLASSASLTIVGDENQSVYSFKHAHPEGISEFSNRHPLTRDEALVVCRRCPRRIVKLANSLIGQNARREARDLEFVPDNPVGSVHIVQWDGLAAEAAGLARFIAARIADRQVVAGKVLVITQRRLIGYQLRDRLEGLGIPAHSFFQEEPLEGDPKDRSGHRSHESFLLLTLLANPDDRTALRCWCGLGSNSLRSPAWARLRALCAEAKISPRSALQAILKGKLTISHARSLLDRFSVLQQRLAELRELDLRDLVSHLFPEGEDWAEPFLAMLESEDLEQHDVRSLHERIVAGIIKPELPTGVPYVRIMSFHKSKGLSADLTVLAGCIEGIIPSRHDPKRTELDENAYLEEQRRLFYVGITRPRLELVISSSLRMPKRQAAVMQATYRDRPGLEVETVASRFIHELGPERPEPVEGRQWLRPLIA